MKAQSTPNIALIKYWGNRDEALRLPAADSLSMTIDSPTVDVDLQPEIVGEERSSPTISIRSFEENNEEIILTKNDRARFVKFLELGKKYLGELGIPDAIPSSLSLEIRSRIPRGIGLASSAAVFSAIAEAIAGVASGHKALSQQEISVLARLGSGSAARSVFGGFVKLSSKTGTAEQVASANHWPLTDIIVIPSMQQKKVGSTEGHALAATSPLFAARLREIPRRMRECIDAILQKDFEKLQKISEEDCEDMHAVMRLSTPSLDYLSPETHRIVREVKELRARERLEVLYTMDAGPTVHLICTKHSRQAVLDFAAAQKGCKVIVAGVGKGSRNL